MSAVKKRRMTQKLLLILLCSVRFVYLIDSVGEKSVSRLHLVAAQGDADPGARAGVIPQPRDHRHQVQVPVTQINKSQVPGQTDQREFK